jgi:hypothetical protein
MDFDKLVDSTNVIGRTALGYDIYGPRRKSPVAYRSRSGSGEGKVVSGHVGGTGPWVTLHDKARGRKVTVRPSQIG